MKLLFLLLLGLASLATAEVVQSFRSKCPQFFYPNPQSKKDVTTPTVLKGRQYKQICQRWKGVYRFATLYDTRRRIPVYSAYTFSGKEPHKRWEDEWMIEPQLENLRYEGDMRKPTENDTFKNQAQNDDYYRKTSCYKPVTRGHVFPRSYAANQDQADSTFTLTNVAPQIDKDNQNWSKNAEEKMLNQTIYNCDLKEGNPAYVVTGVVPGDTWIEIERNGRTIEKGLNIPSHYWTAVTCTKNESHFSTAYIAEQTNQLRKVCSKPNVTELSVDALEDKLAILYKTPLCLFKKCTKKKIM